MTLKQIDIDEQARIDYEDLASLHSWLDVDILSWLLIPQGY